MAGWEYKDLSSVCEMDKSQGLHKNLPYVGLEDIESHTGQFLGTNVPQVVKSSTFKFDTKHVLYGRLRPYLNKVLIPGFSGHCSTEIFPLKPASILDKRYLFYWLTMSSTVDQINRTCTGARMPRANMKEVMTFQIPIPPLPEQKRIVAILDEAFAGIDAAVANTEKNLSNGRELFESYLNGVFTRKGDGWVEKPLEEDIRFIDYRGKTPKKTEEGLRLITAKNVRMGFLQQEPAEFVSPGSYETWMTRGIPRLGDVLFTTEAPLGLVCQLDTNEKVVFAQRIISMQPDRKVINPSFLKYALMSPLLQSRIHDKATGATAQGIKASLLKKITFPCPDLDAQTNIIESLDVISSETERLETIYQEKLSALAELKQAILQKAFAGELTALPDQTLEEAVA